MTREEVLKSGMTLEEYVNKCVEEILAKPLAKAVEGMNADTQAAERRVAELEFEKLVAQNAIYGGVLPKAVKYIAADAAALFEIRDNALVVRNGETDPNDPCVPLTFTVWLKELQKQTPFLFAPEGR